jgi:hypothetical protein
LALVGLAGCSSVGSQGESAPLPGNAPAAAVTVRSAPVVPGRPARVFIFAGFGDHCEPVAAPQITITEPPAKGDVSFVPGQETTIQSSAQGTCIGEKAQGTGRTGRYRPLFDLGQAGERRDGDAHLRGANC